MRVRITKEQMSVALIFFLVLGIRLFLAFKFQGFDYDSYYALRQAEHIRQTGLPLFKDPLSYSGRTFLTPPLFYYLLAGFSFFMPLETAAKLFPNFSFACLVIIVYMIVKHITKNKTAAFTSSLFAGLSPIFISTVNDVSPLSFSLLLISTLSYAFLRIDEKGFTSLSIFLTILLLLTHASVFILLISFFVCFIILQVEKQKITRRELETAIFLFFLAFWFNILLYKKAFYLHGISFIWQNIPSPLLSSYFKEISFFGVIYAVGVIPLLLGVYAVYYTSFKARSRAATLYISFGLVTFIMLWLKLIPFKTGLLILSLNLAILSGLVIKIALVALSKTKVASYTTLASAGFVLLFIITILPSFFTPQELSIPSQNDINALLWIKNNTPQEAVVLGDVKEGFLINYIANRKNVADSNFLFIKGINKIYNDIKTIFPLRLKSEAVRLMNDYDVSYIFLSERTMKEYGIDRLFFAEKDCFDLVYDEGAKVYEFIGCGI